MSSIIEHQGPYDETLTITSANIDQFVSQHRIDVIVMDIEGAEFASLTRLTVQNNHAGTGGGLAAFVGRGANNRRISAVLRASCWS